MRKLFSAALLAAFLSVIISGCYTKFEAPQPSYGERAEQYDEDVYYDDYYWGFGYYPFYFNYGWQGPFLYAYPYFSYGYFYSPWWYDPWYYYYGDSYTTRLYKKAVRDRGHGDTIYSPPPFGITPNPPFHPASTVKDNSSSGSKPSEIKKEDKPKSDSGSGDSGSGKGTRKRR